MMEFAVQPEVLYRWASGPVDAVADDVKTALITLTGLCQDSGLAKAAGSSLVAEALIDVTADDGDWGRDQRYIRGRLYGFAEALITCGRDYENTDFANAEQLKQWFDSSYGQSNEPTELGDSSRYTD